MNFLDQIDIYLIESGNKPRTSHYPSDAASCTRQLYYKWKSEPVSNPIPAGGYWKMRMGTAIHELIYDFVERMGWEVVTEKADKKKIEGLIQPISYRIDLMFKDGAEWVIVECKTGYGAGIRAMQQNGPKDSDIMQVLIYMTLEDIKNAILVYVSRDDGYRTEYHLESKDEKLYIDHKATGYRFADVVTKFKRLEFALNEHALPGRDYKTAIKNGEIRKEFTKDKIKYKSDWQCSYCQWQSKCWHEEIEKYKESDNSCLF